MNFIANNHYQDDRKKIETVHAPSLPNQLNLNHNGKKVRILRVLIYNHFSCSGGATVGQPQEVDSFGERDN